jgi:hypothetical protein
MRLRLLALVLLAAACGGDDDGGFTPTLDNPWHPPGPGHQPECVDQCFPVLTTESHHGDFELIANPADDSGRAQWGRCFAEVMSCWTPDVELAPCATAATYCPQPCRDEFVRLGGDGEIADQIDAFRAVFLADDAPCRAPADEEVQP